MNINGFIWSIADDVLHHVYDRTKYRDIISGEGIRAFRFGEMS